MTPTPGPWAYDGIRVYAPALDEKYTVRNADGTEVEHGRGLIALVYAPPAVTFTENASARAANAALIVAAPRMLQTLKAVWLLAEDLDIGTRERAAFRDLVASVIDEAEGRAEAVTP